jgi:ribosomal protein L34
VKQDQPVGLKNERRKRIATKSGTAVVELRRKERQVERGSELP